MLPIWIKLSLMAVGATLGAWARYYLEQMMHSGWSVWVINTASCFLMGLLVGFLTVSSWGTAHKEGFHLLLLYGFVGGFATFAHFVFWCVEYFRQGEITLSTIYFATSLLAGFVCMLFGLWLGTKF